LGGGGRGSGLVVRGGVNLSENAETEPPGLGFGEQRAGTSGVW